MTDSYFMHEVMNMSKTAVLLMADGVEEIEAIVPYDLLNRAGIKTTLVSVQNKTSAKGNMGAEFTGLTPMKDIDFSGVDALVVPGGDAYAIMKDDPAVLEQIKEFGGNSDKVLGAICAGAAIPGQLGLYRNRPYTCVPGLNGDFGGTYKKEHAVIDGNIVTGISLGGAFEFAFDLIQVILGKEAARKLKADTCYSL